MAIIYDNIFPDWRKDSKCRISWHFYYQAFTSKDMQIYDVVTYLGDSADAVLNGSNITEWNLYTKSSLMKDSVINSDYMIFRLGSLLYFCYNYKIPKVYFFKLIDNNNADYDIGFFDTSGTPKKCFHKFSYVWNNIIDEGYNARAVDTASAEIISHELFQDTLVNVLRISLNPIAIDSNWYQVLRISKIPQTTPPVDSFYWIIYQEDTSKL